MSLSITGYILEPPRVGASNSPFTLTPNNVISDQAVFDVAYPSGESEPRAEYLIQVKDEGQLPGTGPDNKRSLLDATFFWTKNEGAIQNGVQVPFQRFDYAGQDQRFKTLQGAPRELLGTLQADTNTDRLAVSSVPTILDLANFPIRLAVGSFGSSTTFTVSLVALDTSFGSPSAGTVELSLETGNLNWNSSDLMTYLDLEVYYQRQGFFFPDETNGSLGIIGTDDFVLNPLPATGQLPLLKFGFGDFVTATEVVAFSADPPAGTIEWQRATGEVKLNSGDLVTYSGQVLIYDGVAFVEFQVATQAVGNLGTPGTVGPTPLDEAEDLFFVIPNTVQFSETVFVDTLTTPGKRGQVQVRRSDGQVQFSTTDQGQYGAGTSVFVARPDVPIEKGHALRLFRSPVDLGATDSNIKDVTSLYTSTGAVLADPMIGQPSVFLPALPRDDLPIEVRVEQGTGTFLGTLQRLDVGTPTVGKGYTLDFDQRLLSYGARKENEILDAPSTPFGALQLPDFPVFSTGLTLELEDNAGVGDFQILVQDQDFIIERLAGLVTFTQTEGTLIVTSTVGSLAGSTLTDASQNFSGSGVSLGNYLVVKTGSSAGIYTISSVGTTTLGVTPAFPSADINVLYEVLQSKETLADRYFREVPLVDPNTSVERLLNLGIVTNSPRLNINASLADVSRFRFGASTFTTSTVEVATDSAFTSPGLLPSGTVEVSLATGNLNFSSSDLTGMDVYWSRALTLGSDYTLQPGLGFIEFSERMLEDEEVFLSYAILDTEGNKTLVTERGVFLVSKELTQAHPTPTSVLFFNSLGKEVAATPSPRAFRGGRPQVTGTQVSFNAAASTVTFIEEVTVTDALPSGPSVSPEENVYVDYYIYGAIGGEKNVTVQLPPMAVLSISIEEGDTSFLIEGDHTSLFQDQYLLRVASSEVYLLGPSTFDGVNTTVTLDQSVPQAFKSDQGNPTLDLSSGPTRRYTVGLNPSYFVTETVSFDTVPRGSTSFRLMGDQTANYVGGTVTLFSDSTFQDYNLVEGSTYDEDLNRTEVTLATNGSRQYGSLITLRRSVRPILPSSSAEVFTSKAPVLSLPYRVFRQVEGEVGVLLTEGVDYTIDDSGKVTFTDPLTLNEELGLFYTGITTIEAGRRARASWNFALVPTIDNGLQNQVLVMDYTTYIPDTFFYRVETMTNYRGELAQQFEEDAKASSPSQGPILENSAGAQLFEKGNESLYFQEGDLANQDLVAVPTLKFFNDAINHLEDFLQQADGRVVGDRDGRFLFDGLLDNSVRATFADATNQIDDQVTVYSSTTIKAYEASAFSRFFPSRRRTPGQVDPTGLMTGDSIFYVGYKPLQSVELVQRRFPFAIVTANVNSGGTTLQVDIANGDPLYFRPPFTTGMTVRIIDQDGTLLDSGLTVGAVTPTTITVSAVGVAIPVGATVVLDPADTTYRQTYLIGVDLKVNANDGLILYVEPDDIFLPFTAKTIAVDERWDTTSTASHQDTEPFRFPALDGSVSDDDGDIQTAPVLTPQARSELAISPNTEGSNGTGLLSQIQVLEIALSAAQPPFTGTGSLNGAGTTITLTSGTFPSPAPEANDLVRILTGVNGSSSYRRIVSATSTSVTVSNAFTTDSNFTFLVTVSNSVESGSGTVSPTTRLTDGTATFISNGVLVGYTVVMTSGVNSGLRRQVTAVVSETQLDVVAFPTTGAGNYRVDNSLSTYGGTGSFQSQMTTAVGDELAVLNTDSSPLVSERLALENYVDTVASSDKVNSTTGSPSGTTLTDGSQDFVASGVASGDYVFVRSGINAGFYVVASVTDSNNLEVTSAFAFSTTTSYRIFNVNLVSLEGLSIVSTALQNIDAAITAFTTFLNKASTAITVVGDAGAFALGWTSSDFTTLDTTISDRSSTVDSDRSNISAILTSIDRLYDMRFVWIDGRINLETGILVKQTRAIENREKTLAKIIKDLTKLLST